jgi:hypothetical protein
MLNFSSRFFPCLPRLVLVSATTSAHCTQRVLHPQEQLSATEVTAKRPANGTKGSTLDILNFLSLCSALSASFGTRVCNDRGVITQPSWHVRFPRGTLEDAFGSSATTGGLHFTCCTRLSVHQFFFGVIENFSPLLSPPHRKSKKKLKQAKKSTLSL